MEQQELLKIFYLFFMNITVFRLCLSWGQFQLVVFLKNYWFHLDFVKFSLRILKFVVYFRSLLILCMCIFSTFFLFGIVIYLLLHWFFKESQLLDLLVLLFFSFLTYGNIILYMSFCFWFLLTFLTFRVECIFFFFCFLLI